MSHANHISRTPIASRIIPVVVVCLHVVVLGAILWSRFLKLEPLETQPPSMKVELAFAKISDGPESKIAPLESNVVPLESNVAPLESNVVPQEPEVVPQERKVDLPKPERRIPSVDDIINRDDFRRGKAGSPTPVVDVDQLTQILLTAAEGPDNSPTPGPERSPGETIQQDKFDAAATRVVAAEWSDSFSASELTGSGRKVVVHFIIRSNGKVISKRIVRRSGVAAIDRRAELALSAITRFPAPTAYGIHSATYDITCDLEAVE